jgi:1-acyl-sn-glycerol-3-phosphate acyltransferase
MFFYFRRIEIHDVQNVPKNKPVLLLSNHQNALLDALLIAIKCGRSSYFLTRAGVFKKPLVAKILDSLQMLPVYRIRDGWGNLTNNTAVFERCSKLLKTGECIVIFPEGNHNLKRTVRPLSKGFTRIVFDTLEKYPELDLQLLPVGLNFKEAKAFPDSTSIYFGKPIDAKQYISGNKNEDVINLKSKIQSEISQLTSHIPKAHYQETLSKLESLNADFLKPKAVNACIESGFTSCEFSKTKTHTFIRSVFKALLVIVFILPFLVWKYLVKPKIKEIEFLSTFRFALAITIAPLWLIICFIVFAMIFGWLAALSYLFLSLCVALLAVKV